MSHTQGTPFCSKPPSSASKRLRRVQPCSQQNWPKITARAVVDFLCTADACSNLTVSHEWRDECVHAAVFSSITVKPPHREKLKVPARVSPWDTQLQLNVQEWNDPIKQLRMTQILTLRHTSVLSSICLSIRLQPTNEWLATFQGLPHLQELIVEGVPKFSPAAVTNFVLSKHLAKLSLFGYLGIRSRLYQAWATADCEYRFNTCCFLCLRFLSHVSLKHQSVLPGTVLLDWTNETSTLVDFGYCTSGQCAGSGTRANFGLQCGGCSTVFCEVCQPESCQSRCCVCTNILCRSCTDGTEEEEEEEQLWLQGGSLARLLRLALASAAIPGN
jgi:hypothetical protein